MTRPDSPANGACCRPTVAARYRVVEYGEWHAWFSSQVSQRALAGAVGHWISVSYDDPHRVEVVVEFLSIDAARRYEEFLLLPATRADDRQQGVLEHGAVWVATTSDAQRYVRRRKPDDA